MTQIQVKSLLTVVPNLAFPPTPIRTRQFKKAPIVPTKGEKMTRKYLFDNFSRKKTDPNIMKEPEVVHLAKSKEFGSHN